MQHVFWLRPDVIAGRTGPNKDPWQPKELVDGGIGAVLSVNGGDLVDSDALASVGIHYQCIPMSHDAPPVKGDLEHCCSALPQAFEFAQTSSQAGRGLLVHCRSGKDRTGMFMSYYLCRTEGLSPIKAVAEVKRVRPIALSAEGWHDFTLDVLKTIFGR